MSVSGRTVWWAKDAGWYRRAAVIKIKRKYGPLGLVVVDWLTCEAKSQDDGGWVKSGVEAIADGIGSDSVQVRPVLSDASGFGLLDDYEDGGETFTCRISGWAEEQERVADAQRKRAERAASRKKPLKPDPPESERPVASDVSDSVQERPEMSPTGQDRTGQREVEGGDARAELFAAGEGPAADDLRAVMAILQTSPRMTFDMDCVGVASILRAHPGIDRTMWAHTAVSRSADPNWRTTDAARTLEYVAKDLLRSGVTRPSVTLVPDEDPDAARRLANLKAYRIKAEQAAEAARIEREGAA